MRIKSISKKTQQAVAILLAVVLLAALVSALPGDNNTDDTEVESLSHIEYIKQHAQVFNIVEILPDANSGSIGYYVPGYEPTANWESKAAIKEGSARASYVATVFSDMQKWGLMSNEPLTDANKQEQYDNYPLTYVGPYDEKMPWDKSIAGYHELALKDAQGNSRDEYTTLNGTFTPDNNGSFSVSSKESLDIENGTYVQNISYFVYGPSDTSVYYYSPTFVPIKFTSAQDIANHANTPLYEESKENPQTYKYLGTVGSDFATKIDFEYYIVENTGVPSKDYDNTTEGKYTYYAVPNSENPFKEVVGAEGYFTLGEKEYHYVGTGNGSFSFKEEAGTSNPQKVAYNMVYAKTDCGFTNNNWFLRKVLDVKEPDECKLNVRVMSVTPSLLAQPAEGTLDQDTISVAVDLSDMVVVSAGFDLTKDITADSTFKDKYKVNDVDINPQLAEKIQTKITADKLPVIIDGRLVTAVTDKNKDSVPNICKLANELTKDKTAPFVSGSLYCFVPDDAKVDTNRLSLATGSFDSEFNKELYNAEKTPYNEVFSTIEYENFLRERAANAQTPVPAQATYKLQETVTMAKCMRHIINYSGQLQKFNKTAINVLDIEPQTQLTSGSKCLTTATVESWLPANSGIDAKNIKIFTMSMAEFVTKINDVCEDYDLVYIGASLDNFNTTSNGTTEYNDYNMNGLIYSNVGDIYYSDFNLSGLLDSDFTDSTRSTLKGQKDYQPAYRFSGNDLTQTRAKALQDFIDSGFPVIIADELTDDNHGSIQNAAFGVTANIDINHIERLLNGALGEDGLEILSYKVPMRAQLTDDTSEAIKAMNIKYLWFKDTDSGQTLIGSGSEYKYFTTDSASGNYHCEAYICDTNYMARSDTVKLYFSYLIWDWGWKTESSNDAKPCTVTDIASKDESVNKVTVDSSSQLYKILSSNFDKANVMRESTATSYAKSGDTTLLKHLNLSKPSIELTYMPTVYESYDKTCLAKRELTYTFSIKNITDPTPDRTNYTCELYVDQNADGRYGENELVPGLHVVDAGEKAVDETKLVADVVYTATLELPTTFQGIIPWHLEITQNGTNDLIHASQSNYTYYKPTMQNIKVLQITSKYVDGITSKSGFELGGSDKFTALFDDLREKGIYDISVDYQTVTQINALSKPEAIEKFSEYDMLVIGFADCYGLAESGYGLLANGGGFVQNAAQAISDFIDTGKAVLFTHDTTSISNLSEKYFTSNDDIGDIIWKFFNKSKYWNYYFNSVVRDTVGLDRYGVTNKNYKSQVANTGAINGDSNISAFTEKMRNAGYSVAFSPYSGGSDASSLANETQGYTAMTLMRNATTNTHHRYQLTCASGLTASGDRVDTSFATQTNQGQITTFPYKVGKNIVGENIDIGLTHEQYYQLNMNADDTVVWYCLSGGTNDMYSKYFKNDGTNAYYIYNKGNVTYSGAGHTYNGFTNDEAKLFVNTMIAAYRAAVVKPELSFTDASGNAISTQLMPVEYKSSNTNEGTVVEADTRVYFRIADNNLNGDKIMGVNFYTYTGTPTAKDIKDGKLPDGAKELTVSIFNASTNKAVENGLRSNTLYYMVLPTNLSDTTDNAVQLFGRAVTTIGNSPNYGGAALTLNKIGYMMLR